MGRLAAYIILSYLHLLLPLAESIFHNNPKANISFRRNPTVSRKTLLAFLLQTARNICRLQAYPPAAIISQMKEPLCLVRMGALALGM